MTIWTTKHADRKFSNFVRERDGKCLRCFKTEALECSHYWERGKKGTRFDPKNCIALCHWCHTRWDKKQNQEYREFMLKRLGQEEYAALEIRARTSKQMWNAVYEAMQWLQNT